MGRPEGADVKLPKGFMCLANGVMPSLCEMKIKVVSASDP
jgi:hypothetical protein